METQRPTLTALIVELYRRLAGSAPTEALVDAVRQHRWDWDLDEDAKVPHWLSDMLTAALEQRETGTVRFERIGSEVSSFLLEVSQLIPGWVHDEQGESIEIELSTLDIHIHLSRESRTDDGLHCCSYSVTRTHATAG